MTRRAPIGSPDQLGTSPIPAVLEAVQSEVLAGALELLRDRPPGHTSSLGTLGMSPAGVTSAVLETMRARGILLPAVRISAVVGEILAGARPG